MRSFLTFVSGKSWSISASAGVGSNRFSHVLRALLAIGILCGIWLCAAVIQRQTHVPIPAGVLGMGILFLLIAVKLLPLQHVKPGADWLIAEMLLFFVPAIVGVVRFFPVLANYGGRLLIAIVLGTISVMLSTALAVDATYRVQRRLHAKQHQSLSTSENASASLTRDDAK